MGGSQEADMGDAREKGNRKRAREENNGKNEAAKAAASDVGGKSAGQGLQTYVQILGTDTGDTCPSVMIFSRDCRYLFNVGDGLQRFCGQHNVKLVRLQEIFLTRLHADTIGGLLGMYLTLAETGVKKITVHGPPGTSRFLHAGKSFCENRPDSELVADEIDMHAAPPYVDGNISVQPVIAFHGDRSEAQNSREARPGGAISFFLRFPDVQGKLDVERAKAVGVPPGPLFAQLKAGKAVTLPDGRKVEPSECVEEGSPGALVGIMDCPSLQHVASLVAAAAQTPRPCPPTAGGKKAHNTQATAPGSEEMGVLGASFLVHFAPMEVLCDQRYVELSKRLSSPGATHVVVNYRVCPQRMVFPSHGQILMHLNALRADCFPLVVGLHGCGVGADGVDAPAAMREVDAAWRSHGQSDVSLRPADILLRYGLTPVRYAGVDESAIREIEEPVPPSGGMGSGVGTVGVQADALPEALQGITNDACEVVMLGTAASMPGKYRNVSGIYLDLGDRGGILLDCGEGSLGQLSRKYGVNAMQSRLLGLKCVWISHMHADHHLGLLRILSYRSDLMRRCPGASVLPLTVIGPPQLSKWLKTYATFDSVQYDLLYNARFHAGKEWVGCESGEVLKGMCAEGLGVDIVTVPVKHSCKEACAVVVSNKEGVPWKIVYSGDTRPCQALVDAGMDATLLIHEATLESKMLEDAKLKQHSTIAEGLSIGKRMRAFRTVLTHFSQRYPKVPPLEEVTADGSAVVAFDMMCINLAHAAELPLIMPALEKLAQEQSWAE